MHAHLQTVEQLANAVATLKAELAELKARGISSTTVNNKPTNSNTQNNNIHIHVTPRDIAQSKNRDYLDSQFLLECFKDMDMVKLMERFDSIQVAQRIIM